MAVPRRDCIGGSNSASAGIPIKVIFEPGPVITTDVDGESQIVCGRGGVRAFLEQSGCDVGDSVRFSRMGERIFKVRRIVASANQT